MPASGRLLVDQRRAIHHDAGCDAIMFGCVRVFQPTLCACLARRAMAIKDRLITVILLGGFYGAPESCPGWTVESPQPQKPAAS